MLETLVVIFLLDVLLEKSYLPSLAVIVSAQMPTKKPKTHVNIDGKDLKLPFADPQLPPDLVRSFKNDTTCPPYRSIIFTNEFNVARHLMAAGEERPEMVIMSDLARYVRVTIGVLPGARYLANKASWLHLAATTGDIPLFHEILRIGCHLEVIDENGRTPLFAGCERLSSLMQNGKLRTFPGIDRTRLGNDVKRIEKVCILLVEQHAKLDTIIDGKTPLHLACATNSWDLIEVLLQHGADPAPPSLPPSQHCISLLRTSAEKERFKALTHVPHDVERPARPCPCWSGETLENCHARELKTFDNFPYPTHFICRCMSRKTYEKCCHKQGMQWTEAWDPEEMWIQPNRVVSFPAPESTTARETFEMMIRVSQSIADGTSDMTGADLLSGVNHMTARMMDHMVQRGHVDPGFAYAAKKIDFMPR